MLALRDGAPPAQELAAKGSNRVLIPGLLMKGPHRHKVCILVSRIIDGEVCDWRFPQSLLLCGEQGDHAHGAGYGEYCYALPVDGFCTATLARGQHAHHSWNCNESRKSRMKRCDECAETMVKPN
jgi:hypothetical protein